MSTTSRTVVLTGNSYYDAAASTRDADYGTFLATCSEDFYFSTATRWIVLSRLRREIRNNPYLAGLVNKFPEAIGHSTLRSRTDDKAYNEDKDAAWYRYAKRVTSAGDSLRTTEDIVKREMLIAGELFAVKRIDGRVQLIPSEFCGSPPGGARPFGAGGKEVNGILYDAASNIVGYRFGRLDAGAIGFVLGESTVVPAEHVIHIFDRDRVHMGRGLPWLLPCLRPAHDLYEITAAKTKQIKDVSSIFGTLEKAGAAEFLKAAGALSEADTPPTTEGEDDAADRPTTGPVRIELRKGTFIALEPGEKLNVLSSKYEATDYKELVLLMLHAISSPVGLPVELWFSGLGDVAYSGFKGLGTQWNARRKFLHGFFEERFLDPLHEWRMQKFAVEGDLPPNPAGDDDLIDWRWRRTAILDEEKEARANQVRLASGEISHADIWEEKGLYAEEVFTARRQTWIKLLIACGELEEGADASAVVVPRCYILRNELPEDSARPASEPAPTPPEDPDDDDPPKQQRRE